LGRNRFRWDRLAVVVGGVTTTQGVRESRTQGEGPETQSSNPRTHTEVIDLMVDVAAELGHLKKAVRLHCIGKPDAASSCLSGLEEAGRKRSPAKVQRAALPPNAITYLRSGGDIFTLQEVLGHGSLDMVRHYAKVAQVDVEQVHRKASPADNWGL
jgi:site-specific recombinase XerC